MKLKMPMPNNYARIAFIDKKYASMFLKGISLILEEKPDYARMFYHVKINFSDLDSEGDFIEPVMMVEYPGSPSRMVQVAGHLGLFNEKIFDECEKCDDILVARVFNAFVDATYDKVRYVIGPDGKTLVEEEKPTISFLDVINEHIAPYALKSVLNQGLY